MRCLAVLLALPLALAACTQDPAGRCDADLDCLEGQICLEGVCARLETDGQIGSLCARDTDCVGWGECLARTCELRAGACEDVADCENWEVCNVDHACETAPNGCEDETWCGFWQDCVAWRCETAPGYCGSDEPCAAWQYCDAAHLCADVGGTCTVDGECEAWQYCETGHCANQPGRCGSTAECDPSSQVCIANQCVPAPGT